MLLEICVQNLCADVLCPHWGGNLVLASYADVKNPVSSCYCIMSLF
jgi:hypothetical protein